MVEYNEFISMQYHTVTRLVTVSIIIPDGCGYNGTRERVIMATTIGRQFVTTGARLSLVRL